MSLDMRFSRKKEEFCTEEDLGDDTELPKKGVKDGVRVGPTPPPPPPPLKEEEGFRFMGSGSFMFLLLLLLLPPLPVRKNFWEGMPPALLLDCKEEECSEPDDMEGEIDDNWGDMANFTCPWGELGADPLCVEIPRENGIFTLVDAVLCCCLEEGDGLRRR